MRFVMSNGELQEVGNENIIQSMSNSFPLSTAYVVDLPLIKDKIKSYDKGKLLTFAPLPIVAVAGVGGAGIFWQAFMTYIFPYMLDIAKVFCAIKIAQAFYEERRGGREGGSGISAMVNYGKWYLLFVLMPWAVELIDQLGGKMLEELRLNG